MALQMIELRSIDAEGDENTVRVKGPDKEGNREVFVVNLVDRCTQCTKSNAMNVINAMYDKVWMSSNFVDAVRCFRLGTFLGGIISFQKMD
eukprot:762721-Hanusia_phi.AAC.2